MSASGPPSSHAVWRLGHRNAPLDFIPLQFCGWQNRWDDPRRAFRTLYAARDAITCLREVLADLRPDTETLAEIRALFGPDQRLEASAGLVTAAFLRERVLAPATLELDDATDGLVDVDAPAVRADLEREHAAMLAEHGLRHLDLSEIRSRTRVVTQRIARTLYERGAAAITFGSNLDDRPCYAVFEARGRLVAAGDVVELAGDLPELVTVCGEYGLRVA